MMPAIERNIKNKIELKLELYHASIKVICHIPNSIYFNKKKNQKVIHNAHQNECAVLITQRKCDI